jgi:hypothetical protein
MQYGLSEGGIEIFKRVLNRNFNLKSIIAADSLFGKTSFIHEINKERETKLFFVFSSKENESNGIFTVIKKNLTLNTWRAVQKDDIIFSVFFNKMKNEFLNGKLIIII